LDKAPAKPKLTSITVTAPATVTYQVGQKLSTKGLVVTALYNEGVYSRTVTTAAKVTGFRSSSVGKVSVKVAYTAAGVKKTASFRCTIVRATSVVVLKPSRTRVHRAKTRLVVKATISTAVAGVIASGKVKYYL